METMNVKDQKKPEDITGALKSPNIECQEKQASSKEHSVPISVAVPTRISGSKSPNNKEGSASSQEHSVPFTVSNPTQTSKSELPHVNKESTNTQEHSVPITVSKDPNCDSQKQMETKEQETEQQHIREYFTGAQRRRIKAMIRDGMDHLEAKRLERERYVKYKASQAAMATPDGPSISASTSKSLNADADSKDKHEYFTPAQKQQMKATIRDGMDPEEARLKEKERYAPIKASQTSMTSSNSAPTQTPRSTSVSSKDSTHDSQEQFNEVENKNHEHFTGAQKRRIKAMLKSGIDHEEAKRLERERYAKYKESLAAMPATVSGPHQTSMGESEKHKKHEYFTGAQRRRIKAMVRDGMAPEAAKRKERERYAQIKTAMTDDSVSTRTYASEWPKYKDYTSGCQKSMDINERKDEGQNKHEYFTGAQQRRIKGMISDGMHHEEAKHIERERYARFKSSLTAAPAIFQQENVNKRYWSDGMTPEVQRSKIPKLGPTKSQPDGDVHMPTNSMNDERPCTSRQAYYDGLADFKVSITHGHHPYETLTGRQIQDIKRSLLAEIDKVENLTVNLGFANHAVKDGWLSLTCINTETRYWLSAALNRLQPYSNSNIKLCEGDAVPKLYLCVIYIPPDDVLPPEMLKTRLAKQNAGLNTAGWEVLRMVRDNSGGATITISVDQESKNRILAMSGELLLNFSLIRVAVDVENLETMDPTAEITPKRNEDKTSGIWNQYR